MTLEIQNFNISEYNFNTMETETSSLEDFKNISTTVALEGLKSKEIENSIVGITQKWHCAKMVCAIVGY